jgi:hypothetical protein
VPASPAQRLTTAERRAKALKLKTAGADLATIRVQCGYSSNAAASKDLTRAVQQAVKESNLAARELLAVQMARVERMIAGHYIAAAGGSVKSAQVVLSCVDRIVRWNHLDQVKTDSDSAKSVLGALARGLQLAADILPEVDDAAGGNNHDESWEWEGDDDDQGAAP